MFERSVAILTFNDYLHIFLMNHAHLDSCVFISLDSTKPTTKNRRTRETTENDDGTTTKNEKESSKATRN